MIKLRVKVIDELTIEPVKGARVFICENDNKVFMNTTTNNDGVAETRVYLLEDTRIFITVRGCNNKPISNSKIIGPGKELNMSVLIKEDIEEPNESIFKIIKEMFQGEM